MRAGAFLVVLAAVAAAAVAQSSGDYCEYLAYTPATAVATPGTVPLAGVAYLKSVRLSNASCNLCQFGVTVNGPTFGTVTLGPVTYNGTALVVQVPSYPLHNPASVIVTSLSPGARVVVEAGAVPPSFLDGRTVRRLAALEKPVWDAATDNVVLGAVVPDGPYERHATARVGAEALSASTDAAACAIRFRASVPFSRLVRSGTPTPAASWIEYAFVLNVTFAETTLLAYGNDTWSLSNRTATRTVYSSLRFAVRVPRSVTLDAANLTVVSSSRPDLVWALVASAATAYDEATHRLTVALDLDVRARAGFVLDAAAARVAAFNGSFANATIAARAPAALAQRARLSVVATVDGLRCAFGAADSFALAVPVVSQATGAVVANATLTATGLASRWCQLVAAAVSLNGTQATYADAAFAHASATFLLNATVYVAAQLRARETAVAVTPVVVGARIGASGSAATVDVTRLPGYALVAAGCPAGWACYKFAATGVAAGSNVISTDLNATYARRRDPRAAAASGTSESVIQIVDKHADTAENDKSLVTLVAVFGAVAAVAVVAAAVSIAVLLRGPRYSRQLDD
eukprot:m51a1_g4817 putative C-tail anchored protein (576) ;mRNA; f:149012-151645